MTEGRDEKEDRGFVVIDRRGRSDEEEQAEEARENAAPADPRKSSRTRLGIEVDGFEDGIDRVQRLEYLHGNHREQARRRFGS